MVDGRKGSCELYGYDIMLDDQYNPWLIEINCSPAMDYSTSITEYMVKEVMDDTIKIMIDYYYAPWNKKSNVDTGDFVLLVKSDQTVDRPIQSFGLTLLCQGKAIKTS
jgi:tubulin monoglycylase TTLL3/8